MVRPGRAQFLFRFEIGNQRHGRGADGPAAGDVRRRVADDEHVARIHAAVAGADAAARLPRQVGPLLGMVAEHPPGKIIPQARRFQLEPGAARDVAGEQREFQVIAAAAGLEEFANEGIGHDGLLGEIGGQVTQVGSEHLRQRPRQLGRGEARGAQRCENDLAVGLAGEREVVQRPAGRPALLQGGGESAAAGAAGMEQRAVDVEQQEFLVHAFPCHILHAKHGRGNPRPGRGPS